MKKRILFIGPYRQADGWGRAARDIIKSLMTVKDFDVTLRPIYMGMTSQEIDEDLVKLENTIYDEYDYVIQNVLPNFLVYDGRFKKNIGLSFFETKDIETTGWVQRINLMDIYFVCTEQEKINLIDSGVTIPIHVIGPATDCDKYFKSYDNIFADNKNFKFYFIGEFVSRKNIGDMLLAFHNEFAINEDVDFIIKTNIPGASFEQTEKAVNTFIDNIKSTMRLYPGNQFYKKELLILDTLDDETMCKLHHGCDAFVCASYGESICRPALDALGFGNTPIVTDNTGMTTFVNESNGYIVPSYSTPIFSESGTGIPNVYSSLETWQQVDISELQNQMRRCYNNRKKDTRSDKGKADIMKYSFDSCGKKIKEAICQ